MFIVFRFFAGAGSWAFLALSTPLLSPSFLPLSLSTFTFYDTRGLLAE
jgi:hypothetical protein